MRKMKLFSLIAFCLLTSMIILQGCVKDKLDLNKLKDDWNPTFAVPLVNASLSVKDILANAENDLIVVDPTGLVTLVYEGELLSYDAKDLVNLPDQSFQDDLSLTSAEQATLISNGSVSKTENTTHLYNPITSIELDSIRLKAGSLRLTIDNNFNQIGNLTIRIPGFVKNGTVFQVVVPLTAPFSNNIQTINLSGYSIKMATGPGNFNEIPIQYILDLNYNSSQPTTGNISISRDLIGWQFDRLFGFFGQPVVSIDEDSLELNLFKNAAMGYFALTNPSIKLTIENSFGFPIDILIKKLESRNLQSGTVIPIALSNFPNPFEINAPSVSQLGTYATSILSIDKSNSNVDSLITSTPKVIIFGIEGKANPDGIPAADNRNFMTDRSNFKVSTKIDLPMEGFAYGLNLSDTMDFNFSENQEGLESVTFRINIKNGFPLDLRMQFVFLDQNMNRIDSLLTLNENLISSGIVGPAGKVVQPTVKITDVNFDQARVLRLQKAKYVIIRGETNTFGASASSSPTPVSKIYDDYKLDVRLGAKANVRPGSLLN